MKTTVGRVRSLVREAMGEEDVQELDGFRVGQFYKDDRGNVGRLARIYARPMHGSGQQLTLAKVQHGGHSVEQRFDVWSRGKVQATDVEVKKQQASDEADRAHAARSIDTSREGT